MCIMFVYRNPEADSNSYRIILAFNRDEWFSRPTELAHWWKNEPECLGGIDMQPGKEGGTWLAISTEGRMGALLNLTGEIRASTVEGKGRGHLVTDFMKSEKTADEYLTELHEKNHHEQIYNPFNLVLVNLWNADVSLLCSTPDSTGLEKCLDYILGFGNSPTNVPLQKVLNGKKKFRDIVQGITISEADALIANLLELLTTNEKHLPDMELQKRSPNWYKALSSIFVEIGGAAYGTRTHSILLVDGSNRITYMEKTRSEYSTWKYQKFSANLKRIK